MLGLPVTTEFNKRVPKQKFYENLTVSPALKRVFVEQIKLIYWRNKLAPATLNIDAGEQVTELEVFEISAIWAFRWKSQLRSRSLRI